MELRQVVGPLPPADRGAVLALAARAAVADGVAPLDEAALLALTPDPAPTAPTPATPPTTHLLASEQVGALPHTSSDVAEGVVGYLQVDRGGQAATAQLVVDPAARRHGIGRALLDEAVAAGTTEAWAHGDLPAAGALAAAAGWEPVHRLWRMGLDLPGRPRVGADPPVGFVVRHFVPGHDEAAWLAVNARAFADHADQGRWTAADLAAREREPWFDPAGFLLAERAGRLAGFAWTKVHPPGDLAPEAVGELYVLGIDPAAQGLGLGRALTAAALDALAARGLATATLWVAGDNAAAIGTYRRAGFVRTALDVRYAVGATRSPAGAFMGS